MLTAVTASTDTATPAPAGGANDAANATAFLAELDAHAARHDATHKHTAKTKAHATTELKATPKTGAHDKTSNVEGETEAAEVDAAGKPLTAAKKTAAASIATAKADSAATLAASLLTAVNSGAAAAASNTTKPETEETAVTAKGKAKALAQAKRDHATPEKTKTDTVSHDAKPDPSKPADPAAARTHDATLAVKTKTTDVTTTPTDVAPQASAEADAGTPTTPAAGSQVTETRISLAKETAAQPGVAAPMVALRVHTKDGATRAIEIRMDPVGLGPVNVKLETDADGRLRAVLQADKTESFELLKRESGTLEAALREAGVNLGENGLSFSLNDGNQSGADPGQRSAAYDGATTRRDASLADAIAATPTYAAPAWRDGVIDISV